jgi:hypothetical protein
VTDSEGKGEGEDQEEDKYREILHILETIINVRSRISFLNTDYML